MPRVKGGITQKKRHQKVLKRAEGYRNAQSRTFKKANEAVNRALNYAFRDRKAKKRDFRGLWIQRINAAARVEGTTYSRLIAALKKAEVELDRKVLADIAVSDPKAFSELVKTVQA